jgi:ABC-type multidrug transport system fused ATPase/permease subunit
MEVVSKGVVALVIVTLLFLVDAKLALIIGSILGGAYWIIFRFIKKFVNRIGTIRLENNRLRFKLIAEAFGAIKLVKLAGLEKYYIKHFSDYTKNYAQSIASSHIIYQLPRFILETIAFGGVMLIILYLMIQTGTFTNVLPIISLYVFAAYRLMPALQQIYGSLTQLTFVSPSLDKVCEDIKNLETFNLSQAHYILPFNNKITLKNIYYNYPNVSRSTLKNINLSISAKSTVGFVGSTGSGKTTIVDIILGLLEPLKGGLEIDGTVITKKNLRAWQSCIGYVPQDIYLVDDTVASNIAFGANYDNINQQAVEKASKIANLHDFIMAELPHQYKTVVGERGIRLSGGQRQRIGIARALYHNPQILILDEATSALDNQTEKAVMDAVNNLSKNITIIIIATTTLLVLLPLLLLLVLLVRIYI